MILQCTDAKTHPVQHEGMQSIYEGFTANSGLTVDDTVLMFMTAVHGPLHTKQPMVGTQTVRGGGGVLEDVPRAPIVIRLQYTIANALATVDERNFDEWAGPLPAPRNRLTTPSTPL